MSDGLLTEEEAARFFTISVRFLRRLEIPHRERGGARFYAAQDIEDYVEAHKVGPVTSPPAELGLSRRSGVWPARRERILKRDKYTCRVCGQVGGRLHVDHKRPLCRRGSNREGNLWTLCEFCNLSKGTKTVEEFLAARERM